MDRVQRLVEAEIKEIFPKINIKDKIFSSFIRKISLGASYFRFRCKVTDKIAESFDGLKKKYSDKRYFVVQDNGTAIIAIDDEAKLRDFLGPSNKYIEDGSVELVI